MSKTKTPPPPRDLRGQICGIFAECKRCDRPVRRGYLLAEGLICDYCHADDSASKVKK